MRGGSGGLGLGFVLVAVGCLWARTGAAQGDSDPVVLLFVGESPTAAAAWERAVATLVGPSMEVTADFETRLATASARISAPALDRLSALEALLAQGRREAAALSEDRALATLAGADRAARSLLGLPGAHAWLAEVQLWIGVTASQAGLTSLAEASFRRAASLDPRRRLRAAEAPPDVVAVADRAAQTALALPRGRFVVRAQIAGARVIVDDRLLGTTPLAVELPVGLHVLRLEAPGFRPCGQLLEVQEGERPVVDVALGLDSLAQSGQRLARAGRRAHLSDVSASLGELSALDAPLRHALVLETGPIPGRALLFRCSAEACVGPARLVVSDARLGASAAELTPMADAQASRAWLHGPSTDRPRAHALWWERWEIWSAAVLVATAVTTSVLLATRAAPERKLRVTIDPAGIRD